MAGGAGKGRPGAVGLLRSVKRHIEHRLYGGGFWEMFQDLDLFVPYVAGPRREVVRLTFQAAGQSMPLLAALAAKAGRRPPRLVDIDAFCETAAERQAAAELATLFDRHGSDKARTHAYHQVYGAILARHGRVGAMLEIGLGTNDPALISNMGAAGRPGASLRAFRDALPGARVFGADVDRRILFREERIETFFVDQTDQASFSELAALGGFDLIIDDGLHAPNANLASILFALDQLRAGGFVVIEDMAPKTLPVCQVIAGLLPEDWQSSVVRARESLMLVCRRPG